MPLFKRKTDTTGVDLPPARLKQMLDRGEQVLVIDVRQPDGYRTHPFSVPGSVRIPPSELPERYGELPRDRPIVLYCT